MYFLLFTSFLFYYSRKPEIEDVYTSVFLLDGIFNCTSVALWRRFDGAKNGALTALWRRFDGPLTAHVRPRSVGIFENLDEKRVYEGALRIFVSTWKRKSSIPSERARLKRRFGAFVNHWTIPMINLVHYVTFFTWFRSSNKMKRSPFGRFEKLVEKRRFDERRMC